MEEIIGLLVVLAIGIFKAVNKKFEDAGKQPQKPSQPFGPFGSMDPFAEDNDVFAPKPEPIVPKQEPIAPKPVAPKPQPMTFEFVERQTKTRKPMLIEEEESSPKEKIDTKKLVLYSEIMKPKFNE